MDFTVIERAGLTQAQVGLLVGVSRVTINLWSKGKKPVSEKQTPKLHRLLTALQRAVDAGDLPPVHKNNAGEIKAAVLKHLPSKASQE